MFGRKSYHRRTGTWALFRAVPAISRLLVWLPRILLMALIVDLFYVATIWPDWPMYQRGAVPQSNFIKQYIKLGRKPGQAPLQWSPVPLEQMPAHLLRAVVVAEDSRFYQHDGFDLIAFKEAMDYNLSAGRAAFGASTISQQTVKNLFLSPRRDPLRKWHELLLTWGMERNLGKRRILELYLNIAEFGPGVYGVQAASLHYWSRPVSEISQWQAIELAATLPAPTSQNPATRNKGFERRVAKISQWMTPTTSP
jgi:monofunctional biosynthetic peptidoglycan transglycosylase